MVVAFFEAPLTQPARNVQVTPQLRMWREANGQWLAVDLVTYGIANIKLDVSYSHPRRLTFTTFQPQHSLPFADREGIVFTDERYGGFGTPLFEGFIEEIRPVGANEIQFVAYDATKRASDEIFIRNAPTNVPSGIPRLVYNCKNPNDEDKAFERRADASVGTIIEHLLSDPYAVLVQLLAAPPVQVGGPAYVPRQLQPLDFIPQEKVVFEQQTLRNGLERMLGLYPGYRLVFIPGHYRRTWQIHPAHQAPRVTLVLNDFSPSSKHVLSLSLEQSTQDRWTAVKIFGPERTFAAVAQVSDGMLTPQWTVVEGILLHVGGPDAVGPHVGTTWQIAEPAKRHLAKLLPFEVLVPTSALSVFSGSVSMGLSYARTKRPALIATWDGGDNWVPIAAIRLDLNQGIVTAPYTVARQNTDGSWSLPDDVRFYFAYYGEPLSARFPQEGFAGSAFEWAGIETEMQLYDESLAVGYEYGTPVTTEQRIAEFEKLAQSIHQAYADIIYAGGCTIDGLDYDFLHLNRRVDFTAVDADGQPIVTGWEDVQAILTDVEYDFSEQMTTLQFSSDRLEYLQTDPELLKQQLKIRPYRTLRRTQYVIGFGPAPGSFQRTIRTTFEHVEE